MPACCWTVWLFLGGLCHCCCPPRAAIRACLVLPHALVGQLWQRTAKCWPRWPPAGRAGDAWRVCCGTSIISHAPRSPFSSKQGWSAPAPAGSSAAVVLRHCGPSPPKGGLGRRRRSRRTWIFLMALAEFCCGLPCSPQFTSHAAGTTVRHRLQTYRHNNTKSNKAFPPTQNKFRSKPSNPPCLPCLLHQRLQQLLHCFLWCLQHTPHNWFTLAQLAAVTTLYCNPPQFLTLTATTMWCLL